MTAPLARVADEVQDCILRFLDAEDLMTVAGVCSSWKNVPLVHGCYSELCGRHFPEVSAAFSSHVAWAPRTSAEWQSCYGRLRHSGLAHGIRCPCCSRDAVADYVCLFGEHLVNATTSASCHGESSAAAGDASPRMAIPLLQTARLLVASYLQDAGVPQDDFVDLATKTCLEYQQLRAGQLDFSQGSEDVMLPLEDFLDYWRELLLGDGFTGSEALRLRELVIALRHRHRRRGRGGRQQRGHQQMGGAGTPARAA